MPVSSVGELEKTRSSFQQYISLIPDSNSNHTTMSIIKMSAFCKQIYLKDQPNEHKLPEDADPTKYNYSARHPAHKLLSMHGWRVFYANLRKEIESQKSLKIIDDQVFSTPYQLCNYRSDQFSTWNEYTNICRGLVIDHKQQTIIACPFPKFFNYCQYQPTIQKYISSKVNNKNKSKKKKSSQTEHVDEEMKTNDKNQDIASVSHGIYEKVDGSLGIGFYCEYSKQWRIITRGHFGSKQAQWAMEYIQDKNMDESLTRGHTYLFEIVYPENRIGVDYGNFKGLILLHAYNEKGYEYQYEYLKIIADKLKVKVAICYNKKYQTIEDLLDAQKSIDKNKEGFVLCLQNGFRIKFKGEEYLNMLKKKSHGNTSGMEQNVRKMIMYHGVLDKKDVFKQYEDEFYEEVGKIFDDIYGDLLKKTEECVHDLIMTNNLSKNQLKHLCQSNLNNDVKFIAKARKVCDQNLWKSYLGRKNNKKLVGKAINRVTNELLYKKEWRIFIMKQQKKNEK